MRIIKEGEAPDWLKPMTFKCFECECVFEATHMEYEVEKYVDSSRRRGPKEYAYVNCPCCGTGITEDIE